jgi:Domain of unknown function (DUF4232)
LQRRWCLAVTLAGGLALGGCSLVGSSPSKVPGTSGARSGSPTATPCTATQLRVELGRAGAAAGHIGQEVRFRNTSSATCTMKGYPRLQLIGAGGEHLATHVNDGTDYTVQAMPVRSLTLRPRAEAAFLIGYEDGTGYGTSVCPTSTRVQIFAPLADAPLVVAWHLQPYGGPTIARLRCGVITVSPVVLPSQLKW